MKRGILEIAIGGTLAAALALSVGYNMRLTDERQQMEQQMELYKTNEEKAKITERISLQMEDIAYDQKQISDLQRQQALLQRDTAMEMRQMAEAEKRKAQDAAAVARHAQGVAQQQQQVALQQRERAQQEQRKAVVARNVADTLSRLALGRSLASTALKLHESGKTETAQRLAYTAWRFTSDYKGNVYHPEVFSALSTTSHSAWSHHLRGGNKNAGSGITRILPSGKAGQYVSVTKHGEVYSWSSTGSSLNSKSLFANSAYDFRDATIDADGTIRALSATGHLLTVPSTGKARASVLPSDRGWQAVCAAGSGRYMLASSSNIYFYDSERNAVLKTLSPSQNISHIAAVSGGWFVFGDGGKVWQLSRDGVMKDEPSFNIKHVTASALSADGTILALGTVTGTIHLIYNMGDRMRQAREHKSRITQLAFQGNRLISSSLDNNIYLWDTASAQFSAIPLLKTSHWPYCFALTQGNVMWVGTEACAISHLVVSPDAMAADLRRKITRGFTEDEWQYYVGSDVPMLKIK